MKLMFWTLLICFLPNVSIAKTMEFSQIWEVAKNESYQVQKSKIDKDLAETQNSRMKWHWTPSVYVRAGYMKTDNAGQSFFANMSQRAADPTTDFGPTNLNNPDDTSLTETTLGVAWPLYEGGKYRQLKKSTDEMLQAQIYFEKGQTQKLKTDLISAYAEILNHQKNLDDIQPLIKDIEKQLASYQVGKKVTPLVTPAYLA